jgi:uncharacterized protein (DUF1697 family)
MPAVVSLLRAVNVGGHNQIRMEALKTLYESLGLRRAVTHVQSGNVVFLTKEPDLERLAGKIGGGIERSFGFRPDVMLRTLRELREVVARNPFASRPGIEPAKLLVTFFLKEPGAEAREAFLRMDAGPEEPHLGARELYTYYPNGMARPKLSMALVERTLKIPGTGRNWNTVLKLLSMAEALDEAGGR